MTLIYGQTGRYGSRLAEHHKHRFHAYGTKSNMGGAYTDRNRQVFNFSSFRNDRSIGNGVGSLNMGFDVALILHIAVMVHVALYHMGVHLVGRQPYWVLRCL